MVDEGKVNCLKKYIIIFFLIIIFVGTYIYLNSPKKIYSSIIKKETGLNINKCDYKNNSNNHGGMGDGTTIVSFSCNKEVESQIKTLKHWHKIPIENDYEIKIWNGNTVLLQSIIDKLIPNVKIEKGYYYIRNRQDGVKDKYNIGEIYGPNTYSSNYIAIIYDNDTNNLYYYKLDT